MYTDTNRYPSLILGTAMWGWTIPKERCFQLLDDFYGAGFREVDAATNYPINKRPDDFRKGEKLLLEWIHAHSVRDLKVMIKVGSLNNMRSPEHNLSHSFLLLNLDDYQRRFEANLDTFMIHWDNREDEREIEKSFKALATANDQGLRVGISGIRNPAIYARLNEQYQLDFRIQMKHNLLHSDYARYKDFHGRSCFIAYGINAGGIKLNPEHYGKQSSLEARGGDPAKAPPLLEPLRKLIAASNQNKTRPPVTSFNQCGLCFAFHSPDMDGILIGPSRPEQLSGGILFYNQLKSRDFGDFYEQLRKIHNKNAASKI